MKTQSEPEFFSKQVAQARRFFMQKSSLKDTRIKVVCGGCEDTAPDFEIDRIDFPYYCIEFIFKGSGSVTLNNCRHELKVGTLFSYGPGISQHIVTNPDQPMVKYFVDFTGDSVKSILTKYLSPLGTVMQVNRPDVIARIWDELLDHGLSDSPYKSMLCSTMLEYLLYRIADIATNNKESPSGAFTSYQYCRQFIQKHFISINSLEDIAEACSIDHAYLCRLFKRYDTQSPYQYLLSLKMAYAADRFRETGDLVKEIAHELGFHDPFHFTRTFKRVFGISPKTFKRLR